MSSGGVRGTWLCHKTIYQRDKARVVGTAIARIYIVYNYHPVSVNLLGFRETFKTLFIVLGGQGNVVVSQDNLPDPQKALKYSHEPPPPQRAL